MRNKLIKGALIALAIVVINLIVVATTTSSTYEPKIEKLEDEELEQWSNRNDTIFRRGETVAIFEHYEYELNPNHRNPKMQAELCFIQVDDEPQNTIDLIRYIHTMHTTSKIQIEFKDQYDRVRLWGKRME